MAINPDQINLITYKGLPVAFDPALGWILSIQDPTTETIQQISLQTIGQLLNGSMQLPDGVIAGLELTFNNGTDPKTVSVSQGQWRIDGTVFFINVPFVSNINATPATDRTDAILADDTDDVFYVPNFNGTLADGQILVATFIVKADGSDIEPVVTNPVIYAVMNGLNIGDFNITGQFMVNGVPIGSGGGSAALPYSFSTIGSNGRVGLTGLTGLPAPGTENSALTLFIDGQPSPGIYYPDTQEIDTGYEAGSYTVTGKITF